jgi:hypothetical protein
MSSVCCGVIQASCPVTIAAPMPPLVSPIRATIRWASRQRAALIAIASRSRQGGRASSASSGAPSVKPTPPTLSNQASRAKS